MRAVVLELGREAYDKRVVGVVHTGRPTHDGDCSRFRSRERRGNEAERLLSSGIEGSFQSIAAVLADGSIGPSGIGHLRPAEKHAIVAAEPDAQTHRRCAVQTFLQL
jgi:hypothetical protein